MTCLKRDRNRSSQHNLLYSLICYGHGVHHGSFVCFQFCGSWVSAHGAEERKNIRETMKSLHVSFFNVLASLAWKTAAKDKKKASGAQEREKEKRGDREKERFAKCASWRGQVCKVVVQKRVDCGICFSLCHGAAQQKARFSRKSVKGQTVPWIQNALLC